MAAEGMFNSRRLAVGCIVRLGGIMILYCRARSCLSRLPSRATRARSCLGKRKSLRDERLDLVVLEEIKQGDQILSKNSGFSRLSVWML